MAIPLIRAHNFLCHTRPQTDAIVAHCHNHRTARIADDLNFDAGDKSHADEAAHSAFRTLEFDYPQLVADACHC